MMNPPYSLRKNKETSHLSDNKIKKKEVIKKIRIR